MTVALARRTPERGRTRGSGAWPVRSVQAAGSRVRAAPTMTRLLRWLAVDGDEHERIRSKTARSLARCTKTTTRQIGLLRVLVGDVTGAAAVLAKSPGLGWSNPDHPGHTLFPLLAMLLSNGTIGGACVTELEATGRDPLESFCGAGRGAQAKTEDTIHRGADPERASQHRADRPGSPPSTRCASQRRSDLTGSSATPGASTTVTRRCSSRRASPLRPRTARPSS